MGFALLRSPPSQSNQRDPYLRLCLCFDGVSGESKISSAEYSGRDCVYGDGKDKKVDFPVVGEARLTKPTKAVNRA